MPNDPRSAGGHGLGPTANAESCVACHVQGGVGGAGGRARNVSTRGDLGDIFGGRQATMVPQALHVDIGALRNPPALFGAGLIDRVPASELRKLAATPDPAHPEITGRVSDVGAGEVGRFAWKGHVASLADFVAQACEVELGLVVERPGDMVAGADLRTSELEALTAYVGALAAPEELADPGAARGEAVFEAVGCAACHVASVRPAKRLFSDLLLHDMGPALSDAGVGYGRVASSELVAIAQEWHTAPLWGIGDSAPYLHDGRADSLDEAIALHGGEATRVASAWAALPVEDRAALNGFLRSLKAPRRAEHR